MSERQTERQSTHTSLTDHVAQIGSNAKAYRDARLEQVHFSDHAGPSSAGQEQTDSQQGEENTQRPDDSLALDLDTGSEADAEGAFAASRGTIDAGRDGGGRVEQRRGEIAQGASGVGQFDRAGMADEKALSELILHTSAA